MLTYFPTPYPGEWWYSVLCRYHLRTGYAKHQTTVRELFQGKPSSAIGAVLPNSTIPQISAQLPPTALSVRDTIINHTLFPFYMRFYRLSEKEAMLERLMLGKNAVVTSIRLISGGTRWSPRYCPVCFQADCAAYGESYWHIEHQIPLMRICPVHGCLLIQAVNIQASHLSYAFHPLDSFSCVEPVYADTPEWENRLSKLLMEYQQLPLHDGITNGYNNLAIALGNMGYEVIQDYSENTILDAKRLYRDLTDFFGEEMVQKVFGDEKSICLINRVCKWEIKTPERYALLQCFAGVNSELFFEHEQIHSQYENKLERLQGTGILYGKKQLADSLGITCSQLDILTKKYGIKPFWVKNKYKGKEALRKMSIQLNKKELEIFKRALHHSGYRYDSHFAKHCIMTYIKEHSLEAK